MIKFNDGMSFDTSGDYRLVRKSDGYYVVGQGMLCPVDSAEEGRVLIQQYSSRRTEMSKNESSTKILKRKTTANLERMKEVLDEIPNTDVPPQNTVSDVLIPEAKPAEQAVNSSENKPAENAEKPKQKKAPVNKRAYTYAECAKIIEMINAGKTLDEIHQETKRPVLSLMYKFFNPKRGVKMCRDVEELKKFFPIAE